MIRNGELTTPPLVEKDPKAFELLRIWVAFENQHINVRLDTFKDPAERAVSIVDVIKLIAKGDKEQRGEDPEKVLSRIIAGFEAEYRSLLTVRKLSRNR